MAKEKEENINYLKELFQVLEPLGFSCSLPGRHVLERIFEGIQGEINAEFVRKLPNRELDIVRIGYYLNGASKLDNPNIYLKSSDGRCYKKQEEPSKLNILIKKFFCS